MSEDLESDNLESMMLDAVQSVEVVRRLHDSILDVSRCEKQGHVYVKMLTDDALEVFAWSIIEARARVVDLSAAFHRSLEARP